ncbi:MAG: hypothetical protein ACTIIZ_06910 [Levilactobacillus brevis]
MEKTQKTITVAAAPFNIKDRIGYMFGDMVDCKFNPNFWTNLSA